jgi:hypothetical protein
MTEIIPKHNTSLSVEHVLMLQCEDVAEKIYFQDQRQ